MSGVSDGVAKESGAGNPVRPRVRRETDESVITLALGLEAMNTLRLPPTGHYSDGTAVGRSRTINRGSIRAV